MKKKKFKEIVINKCYGGFSLNHRAMMLYAKLSGFKLYPFVEVRKKKGKEWSALTGKYTSYINPSSKSNPYDLIFYSKKLLRLDGTYEKDSRFWYGDIKRDDPILVKVIKILGKKAIEHSYTQLKIVKISANIDYEIAEYDGIEWIAEKHKIWS